MSEKTYEERLEDLISEEKNSKDSRTLEFLESLRAGLEKWGSLTAKQISALEKIEKLSTPEAKKQAEEWVKIYPTRYRNDAVVCAKYYLANPPYFSDVAKMIVRHPSFVPTESQFRALTENPYATKILKEYHRKPNYQRGDLVQIRDCATIPFYLSAVKSRPCVVIDNNHGFLTTHAKGAKTYKLLPIGRKQTLLCQERWIKNFRNKTNNGK